jgi:hypothetical protein
MSLGQALRSLVCTNAVRNLARCLARARERSSPSRYFFTGSLRPRHSPKPHQLKRVIWIVTGLIIACAYRDRFRQADSSVLDPGISNSALSQYGPFSGTDGISPNARRVRTSADPRKSVGEGWLLRRSPAVRRSNIDASADSPEEMQRVVAQIRVRWPKTRITLRGNELAGHAFK